MSLFGGGSSRFKGGGSSRFGGGNRLKVGFRSTGMFFDRQVVVDALTSVERQKLSKFGAFVRQTARRSIIKRKSISKRGSPPSSHTGGLKRLIFFAFDPVRRSVVIGPELFPGLGMGPYPTEALEYGGSSIAKQRVFIRGRRRASGGRSLRRGRVIKKKIKIAQRPFMGPAFEKQHKNVAQLWADSI